MVSATQNPQAHRLPALDPYITTARSLWRPLPFWPFREHFWFLPELCQNDVEISIFMFCYNIGTFFHSITDWIVDMQYIVPRFLAFNEIYDITHANSRVIFFDIQESLSWCYAWACYQKAIV
jgi:hypothetical protein